MSYTACPCVVGVPCNERCTCAHPASSRGCTRCNAYGTLRQGPGVNDVYAVTVLGHIPDEIATLRTTLSRVEAERDGYARESAQRLNAWRVADADRVRLDAELAEARRERDEAVRELADIKRRAEGIDGLASLGIALDMQKFQEKVDARMARIIKERDEARAEAERLRESLQGYRDGRLFSEQAERRITASTETATAEAIAAWLDERSNCVYEPERDSPDGGRYVNGDLMAAAAAIRSGAWRTTDAK